MHGWPLPARRSSARFVNMPYGVVMATGGAGEVADLCGWHGLAMALTGVAVLQAVLIPAHALWAQHGFAMPRWRFGWFTVALGLAVIAGNLRALAPVAADVTLTLAWLATLALGCWWVVLAFLPAERIGRVDGTWFLAPAALLGDAAATATAVGVQSGWVGLAIVACLVGVAGYVLVLVASGFRWRRRGLEGSPLAPWWISAGCGGLAAAALGKVADVVADTRLHQALDALVAASWIVGSILLVTVLIGCATYAARRPRGPWTHVWTPVFSMAVYAAGTDRFTQWSGIGWMQEFVLVTVLATLSLWAVNSALSWSGVPATRS